MGYNSGMSPLKVVLIEGSFLTRQTLGGVLNNLASVEVVGEADDEGAAIELLQDQQPDLAIIDLQLRAGSGLGVLRALSRAPDRFGKPRVIVFSSHGEIPVRDCCFALGAERFFDKATEVEDLVDYVRQTTVC